MFYSVKLKLITIYLSSIIKRVRKCRSYVRRPNSWFFHTCKSESYGWFVAPTPSLRGHTNMRSVTSAH